MKDDLPAFVAHTYSTSNTRGDLLPRTFGDVPGWGTTTIKPEFQEAYRHRNLAVFGNIGSKEIVEQINMSKPDLRIVRVFLVDPDDRIPVDKRILYRSEEMTTDATDQELYFGIPVNELLKQHNAYREIVEWEEKTSEGTKTKVGLKEARIRDLVMSVTTIASFKSMGAA